MKERERIESASVTKEIKETRQRLEDDRTRQDPQIQLIASVSFIPFTLCLQFIEINHFVAHFIIASDKLIRLRL